MLLKTIRALTRPRGFPFRALRSTTKNASKLRLLPSHADTGLCGMATCSGVNARVRALGLLAVRDVKHLDLGAASGGGFRVGQG